MHACLLPPARTQEVEETKEEAAAREREAREAEQRSEFENIQAGRKLLPMFPYRQGCAQGCACWLGRAVQHAVIMCCSRQSQRPSMRALHQAPASAP